MDKNTQIIVGLHIFIFIIFISLFGINNSSRDEQASRAVQTGNEELLDVQILQQVFDATAGAFQITQVSNAAAAVQTGNGNLNQTQMVQQAFIQADGTIQVTCDNCDYRVLTEVDTATYTLLITDRTVAVDYTATGAVTLTLPAASTAWDSDNSKGLEFLIKDTGVNASINTITINRAGSDTIIDSSAAQTSTTISTNGGAIWIGLKDASTWIVY